MQKPSPNNSQTGSEYPLPQQNAQPTDPQGNALRDQLDAIPRFQNPTEQAEVATTSTPALEPVETVDPTTLPSPAQAEEAKKRQKAKEKLQKLRKHPHFRTVRFAVISFLLFVLIFNFPLIYSQVVYWSSSRLSSSNTNQSQSNTITPSQTNPQAPPTNQAEVVGPENRIIIPKINVNAPIVFVPTLNEAEILRGLESGVVHYAGTANPGENGNAVLFGHSSNDWWQAGNYKFIFVLLERLTVGDTYEIHYQSRKYVYKVVETKVVNPTDLSVLTQTSTPFSTIITCTPPGTSWRRFVVKAEQIAPAVTAVVQAPQIPATDPVVQPSELPSAAPNVFDQIVQFFSQTFSRFFGGSEPNNSSGTNTTTPTNRLPETF